MEKKTFEHFCQLRQDYYIAARSNMVNQLYNIAGINFGYCIELSLKFILRAKNHANEDLKGHKLKSYLNNVTHRKYIQKLNVSDDFVDFTNRSLNSRYPMNLINRNINNKISNRPYFFPIDYLHCYDDFILQLDDQIFSLIGDPKSSIGIQCTKKINTSVGRIFFHCNDHAFERIPKYLEHLNQSDKPTEPYNILTKARTDFTELWNFTGLMAYRPWGPKINWNPAKDFIIPEINKGFKELKTAL